MLGDLAWHNIAPACFVKITTAFFISKDLFQYNNSFIKLKVLSNFVIIPKVCREGHGEFQGRIRQGKKETKKYLKKIISTSFLQKEQHPEPAVPQRVPLCVLEELPQPHQVSAQVNQGWEEVFQETFFLQQNKRRRG